MITESQVQELHNIARRTGQAIMSIYESDDFGVEHKEEEGYVSPLTKADLAAHEIIQAGLELLTPDIPILSEESKEISYEERKQRTSFRCVDPLDGTKEFIKRNGEFTVNIALIEDGYPIFGLIYVPVTQMMYRGIEGEGAWRSIGEEEISLQVQQDIQQEVRVVTSRSHSGNEDTSVFQQRKDQGYEVTAVSRGSALKFCLVAENEADVYLRAKPTMERDTAAGQCIIEAAGGHMWKLGTQERFQYNKEQLRNEGFIVTCDIRLIS